MSNLADEPAAADLRRRLDRRLDELMAERNDELVPCHTYGAWFDHQRRVIRNARGPLGDPEALPDFSLLG